jgi:hypothetical protein
MLNLSLFIQNIKNELPKIYQIYSELIDKDLIVSPIIYTDHCDLFIDKNIPVFSSFYMRHHFGKNLLLLVDHKDLEYVPVYIKSRCVVMYNNNIICDTDKKSCFSLIRYDESIESKLYDKKIR